MIDKIVMSFLGCMLAFCLCWLTYTTIANGPTTAAYLAGMLTAIAAIRFAVACYRIFRQESKNNERRND